MPDINEIGKITLSKGEGFIAKRPAGSKIAPLNKALKGIKVQASIELIESAYAQMEKEAVNFSSVYNAAAKGVQKVMKTNTFRKVSDMAGRVKNSNTVKGLAADAGKLKKTFQSSNLGKKIAGSSTLKQMGNGLKTVGNGARGLASGLMQSDSSIRQKALQGGTETIKKGFRNIGSTIENTI